MEQTESNADFSVFYEVGDKVIKRKGDYTFEGEVRGVVKKIGGAVRYVVEDSRGMLMIVSANQLESNNEEESVEEPCRLECAIRGACSASRS